MYYFEILVILQEKNNNNTKAGQLITKKTVLSMKWIYSSFSLIPRRNDLVPPPIVTNLKKGISWKITIKVKCNVIQYQMLVAFKWSIILAMKVVNKKEQHMWQFSVVQDRINQKI